MIQSRDNPRYKRLQRIAQGKRPVGGGEQQLWLEGIHLCQSWIERFGAPEGVVVDAEALASDAEIQELLAVAAQAEPQQWNPMVPAPQHFNIRSHGLCDW